jgi:hypothetical protein
MPKPISLLRAVVISPGDVLAERDAVEEVLREVNRDTARQAELHIELWRWETDAHAGFHPEGPQGLIDPILDIADCDLVILILWSRLGTRTPDGKTGTEHEFQTAYGSWKAHRRPQIMAYFRDFPTSGESGEDGQVEMVRKFKEDFPLEGLTGKYADLMDFRRVWEKDLRNYLNAQIKGMWNRDAASVRAMIADRKKEPPTIAILGRMSERDPRDPGIIRPNECKQALIEIGKELQAQGYRLMVYDSGSEYAANEVIQGYISGGNAKPGSVRIRRPLALDQGSFSGQAPGLDIFVEESIAKPDWEVAFFTSLSELDGAVVVGNGYFTLIGGLQVVGARLPILVLGGFGGVAGDVWEVLQGQRSRFASDQEVFHMAKRDPTPEWAKTCVQSLGEQRSRRDALQIWKI